MTIRRDHAQAQPPDGRTPRYEDRFDDLARVAHRVAFRVTGSREDAREIAQEALARAYAHWPRIHERAGGWVARVATNLALDLVRRRQRAPQPQRRPAPADLDRLASERADLVAALRRLPRRQRDVVFLRHLADLSEQEVAETLQCSVGTVKSHGHRGIQSLRAALTDPRPDPRPDDRPDPTPPANARLALDEGAL